MSEHRHSVTCDICGAVPFSEALREWREHVGWYVDGRLISAEAVLRMASVDERAALYEYIVLALRRAPLDKASRDPGAPFATVASFFEAVRFDLGQITVVIDPTGEGFIVPQAHPRVIAADRGETTYTDVGYSRTFRVNGHGVEVEE